MRSVAGRLIAVGSFWLLSLAVGAPLLVAAPVSVPEPARITHSVNAPIFEGDRAREREHFEIVSLPFPPDSIFEWTAVEVLPDQRLAVATRWGEIWLVHGAFAADVANVTYTLWATSLHEPLSLSWRDGWLYVTERGGITRMRDRNGDGRSDEAEVVTAGWGLSADDHEYAFSSPPDRDGNIWTVLCLSASIYSRAPWRGWAVRTSPDGVMTPMAAGIRSPGGVGFSPSGEPFSTDNQGFWVGTSVLRHLRPGTYHGSVPALEWWEQAGANFGPRPAPPMTGRPLSDHQVDARFLPPAVLLPHQRVGRSPTGFDFDTSGRFGPFSRQLILADHSHANLLRVDLEEVGGFQQGVVFPFFYGLEGAPIGVRFASDGTLFVSGCSRRGWASRAPKPFALERIRWTGVMPFEVLTMRVWAQGFDLTFTEEVDAATAGATASYQAEAWTYQQSTRMREYGSPELDKFSPRVVAAEVSPDRRRVRLTLEPMTPGHLHQVGLPGVRNRQGKSLVHPIGWYTLNALPGPAAP